MPRRLVTGFLCVLAVLAALAVGGPAAQARGQLVEHHVVSRAIHSGTLSFSVYLPAGYAEHPELRYPVLYVLHGLPGDASSYRSLTYLTPVLDRLHTRAIVVFAQGATDGDSDDEYLDLGPGRNWETALTRELPAAVAARYRVLPGRSSGILGVSAGGYGAAILGLHHLDRYRVVESWSGYFHATNPDGSAPMRLPAAKAAYADAHRLVSPLAAQTRRYPTLIGFYTGSRDPYRGFTDENRQFDRELAAAGVRHRFAVYSGGHDSTLWLAHARDWLGQALRALGPPR